jgi:hypothetical protein
MSTTTLPAPAPLPPVISPERFGEFIKILDVVNQNRSSTLNAKVAYQNKMLAICEADPAKPGKFKFIDIKTVDAVKYEALIAPLARLRANLIMTEAAQKDRRKPFTDDFATIVSAFTTEEKETLGMAEKIKGIEDAWEKEKLRRTTAAKTTQTNAITKAQEAIDAATAFKQIINTQFASEVLLIITKLREAYYKQTLAAFDGYLVTLTAYNPVLDPATWMRIYSHCIFTWTLHKPDEAAVIFDKAIADAKPVVETAWATKLTAERDRLIALAPARKTELEALAAGTTTPCAVTERIAEETKTTYTAVTQQAIQANLQAESTANVDKVTASFEVASAAPAVPTPPMKKGTAVKKKYKCTTHAAFEAIIKSWVKNEMPTMSIDDINIKLSFMRTAGNARLNAGEVIEADGLIVEDDVSTRATKITNTPKS